jgi:Ni/Fe-hydrogenase subunit HybB-like protein
MWLKRFLIIVPTLRQGLFPVPTQSYSGSITEVAITLGAFAAIPLILMLLFKVFPVLSIHEIEEVKAKEYEPRPELASGWEQVKGGDR